MVPEEVPVLRLQLARDARRRGDRCPSSATSTRCVADLEAALPLVWGRTVHSIFIGGGTPSLFSPQAIDRLLADIRARLPLEPDCEITLEANPGTFERDRFRAFRAAGVTRLSVGVQSFNDAHLQALGRVHDRAQAHRRGRGGGQRLRHLQPRPDVRAAGPDAGRARGAT